MAAARRFAAEQPAVWHALLDKLATATGHFLTTLVRGGADVYQLFDSCAGMLDEADYRRWAQPYHETIFQAVTGVPRSRFVNEGPYLPQVRPPRGALVRLRHRH